MRRDLVERAMAHDHEAFTELARLSIDKLYAIARLILHDPQRAEDATQEALVSAWRDIAALRDPDRFEAWLRRLLVHACYRESRRQRARQLMEVHVPLFDRGVADRSADVADRDQLEPAFLALRPEQRALVVLHYYLDLPLEETAEALGIPVGTAKSRLHRTTQAMRATLDAQSRVTVTIEERTA